MDLEAPGSELELYPGAPHPESVLPTRPAVRKLRLNPIDLDETKPTRNLAEEKNHAVFILGRMAHALIIDKHAPFFRRRTLSFAHCERPPFRK
jgi:hypothetical protein